MIAKLYICPDEGGLALEVIPADWVSMINANTSIKAYLTIFDQLVEFKALQEKQTLII